MTPAMASPTAPGLLSNTSGPILFFPPETSDFPNLLISLPVIYILHVPLPQERLDPPKKGWSGMDGEECPPDRGIEVFSFAETGRIR